MNVKVYGTEKVISALKSLEPKLKKDILVRVFKNAAKPIIESAKSKIWKHQIKGRLIRSLGTVADKKQDIHVLRLGARMFGQYKGQAAHLLENGTVSRYYTTKRGIRKGVGRVKGINYWEQSLKIGSIEDMPNQIVTEMEKTLRRFTKRIRKISV